MKKLEYIQQWRGLAILLVLFAHSRYSATTGVNISIIDKLIWFGGHGVTLFFVLSAFTLMYSQHRDGSEQINKKNFFIKRFFRIAPLYYLGLVFYRFYSMEITAIDWNFILNLFFFTWPFPDAVKYGVPGGWSITTEFTFYYILPFIYAYVNKQENAIRYFLVGILISRILVAVYSAIYPGLESHYYLLNPLAQFPVFLTGIMLFNVIVKNQKITFQKTDLLLIALILFLEYGLLGFIIREPVIISLMFAVLIYINSTYKVNITIINKPLSFIGELSFTIYLTHFAALDIISKQNIIVFDDLSVKALAFRFVTSLILSLILSIPIYYLIEKPFMNLAKTLTKK